MYSKLNTERNNVVSIPGTLLKSRKASLQAEDERRLIVEAQDGNQESLLVLIESFTGYILRIINQNRSYHVDESQLLSEGIVGFISAVKNFDRSQDSRLITLAERYIKSAIYEYVIKNLRIVKLATTKPKRRLFFNVRSAAKKQSAQNPDLSKKEIVTRVANELNVCSSDVEEMLYYLSEDGFFTDILSSTLSEYDDTEMAIIKKNERERALQYAESLAHIMDPREHDIIVSRWLLEDTLTLEELGLRYNVSAERIRQLEKQAMSFLRTLIH
jgi:RNA polymerase sigma-32 factor